MYLPTSLLGTSVKVTDSAGHEQSAPLFYVSQGQVNYLMPSGTALGAATVTITSGDGTSTKGYVQIAPVPIDFGAATDQLYLEIFSTGVRGISNPANASVTVGGNSVPVQFAGAAPGFIGLDQVDAGPLPRSLAGSGKADITVTIDGQSALVTNLVFQ